MSQRSRRLVLVSRAEEAEAPTPAKSFAKGKSFRLDRQLKDANTMGSEEGAGERGENEMIRRYRDKEKDKVMLRGKATEIGNIVG